MTAEFLDTGMTELIESAACRNLVPSGAAEPTDPSRCKAPDVQSRLSLVLGWDMTFSMVPGLLAAVPYGVFADTYGPRVVLLLVFVGITMSKTLQLVICTLCMTDFQCRQGDAG
jgi:MFS family permease